MLDEAMNSNCPNPSELKSFVIGDLPLAGLDQIASHLTDCDRCGEALRAIETFEDELVQGLRSLDQNSESTSTIVVPPSLARVARNALRSNGSGESPDVSLDPGFRLARKLKEGHCRLGRFELESELGVGSFGYVFRARDTQLDRTVALKIQRAGCFASDEEIERFLREARSVAQLKHPGIVAIHDTVRTEDEVCYLVTEYVEGESLESRLQSGRLDNREVARLVAEIADALQYAHDHGVVHRDVKPSNILVDNDDHPHVMDFGLAKRDVGETMTSEGRIMGTPAYMSPEQASGLSHQVDARSDIFSLGVVLYEMLTGERPFQGNRRMLLLQVMQDEPRPLRQLEGTLPRDLETICLKALAKSPARRYQSSAEVADDLRHFLRGEPIKARRMGYSERLWRWCRRYPLAASLLVAIPIGSLVGFAYLSQLSTQFVQSTALESTRMEADMLEKINEFYSEEVVGRLDWEKIKVTHQYATVPQSIPLPFTFMIDAGQRITEDKSGMQVRIYSDYPWREIGGPQDEFERQAVEELQNKVTAQAKDRSYHQFTEIDGRPALRYARAQIMAESCIKCHNDHQQSPKKDWKEGDLAGVLAITRPLERDIQSTRSGLRGAFNVMGAFAASLTSVLLVLLWTARRRSRNRINSGAADSAGRSST